MPKANIHYICYVFNNTVAKCAPENWAELMWRGLEINIYTVGHMSALPYRLHFLLSKLDRHSAIMHKILCTHTHKDLTSVWEVTVVDVCRWICILEAAKNSGGQEILAPNHYYCSYCYYYGCNGCNSWPQEYPGCINKEKIWLSEWNWNIL